MSTGKSADVHSEGVPSQRPSVGLPALMGTLFVLLFLLGLWLISTASDATLGKNALLKFYQSDQNRLLVIFGVYLVPFAGIAFLWFVVSLQGWMIHGASREDKLLSSMQLGSALIFVVLFFCTAASGAAIAVSVQYLGTPVPGLETARELPEFAYTLFFVYAMRAAAMFTLVTSRFGQTMNLFPRWLSIVGYLAGIFLMLSVTFSHLLVLIFPLWLLMLCTFLFYRFSSLPALREAKPAPLVE